MSKKILVVEDTEDNRRIIRDLLGASGYALLEATDGAEGVELARRERPDLIAARGGLTAEEVALLETVPDVAYPVSSPNAAQEHRAP